MPISVVLDISVYILLYLCSHWFRFRMFSVIVFVDTNEEDVVPQVWLQPPSGTRNLCACMWPPYKTNSRMLKAKLNCEQPLENWTPLTVDVTYGPTGSCY